MNALRLAFGLLTAVPVGRLPETSRRSAGAAIVLAPVTVLPMLAVLWLGHAAVAGLRSPALLVAAGVVTVEALLTRAMHLDGLADTADGLSAGYDAASSLRAMKASDIGPSGVAALALALLLQVAALGALLPSMAGTALAGTAWLLSRQGLSWACTPSVPAAAPTGLGAMVAGSVRPMTAGLGLVVVAAAAVAGVAAAGAPLWLPLAPLAAGLLAVAALLRRARRRLGGITGDVLGAAVELALTASLFVASLVLGPALSP